MRPRDALLKLCKRLAPGIRDLEQEVALAVDQPETYAQRFQHRMAERWIESPIPDLAWIALIDGLTDRRRLAEVDWKEHPRDIIWALDITAPGAPDRWNWVTDAVERLETGAFLHRAGEELCTRGLLLVQLDIESDSYPLMLVKPRLGREAQHLARAAGQRIVSFAEPVTTRKAAVMPRATCAEAATQCKLAVKLGSTALDRLDVADLAITQLPATLLDYLQEAGERPISFASAVGWRPSQTPTGIGTPAEIDRVLLTDTELSFAVAQPDGALDLRFELQLKMIDEVHFDPAPAGAASVPTGVGLAQIFTTTGRTLVVCTQSLAHQLRQAVLAAKAAKRDP